MPTFNLDTFNSFAYETLSEVAPQNINAFNEASAGAIRLVDGGYNIGDTDHSTFFKEISDLATYRDVDSEADVSAVDLEMGDLSTVKVAGRTPPVKVPPSKFHWIKENPKAGGVAYGEQLGVAIPQHQLNAGIAAAVTTMNKIGTDVVNDISAEVGDAAKANRSSLVQTAGKFGDRSMNIRVWLLHSAIAHTILDENTKNADRLFRIGDISIFEDGFGRRFIMTDSPSLDAGSGDYYSLGLTDNAILLEDNADMEANMETNNGGENIRRTLQSEWSFNLGIKGNGWISSENSPNLTALQTSANWGKSVTSVKNTAGVMLKSKA
jgi:hypothetical protein